MADVIGYHLVFGAYGFWLPNDPRGSWSETVWAEHLVSFGDPIPVSTRRSQASAPHDTRLRVAAKNALLLPPVVFDEAQSQCVGSAIGQLALWFDLPMFAVAVMPDHVHLVIGSVAQKLERQLSPAQWIGRFKSAASKALSLSGLHSMRNGPKILDRLPSPWSQGGWRVYLYTPGDVERAVRYVEQNPGRAGLEEQKWDFVTSLGSAF